MAAGLPAVEHNGYVMSLQLFVRAELLYEFLPFLPKIAVLYADEVVAVYDDSGNSCPSEEKDKTIIALPMQKRPPKVLTADIGLLQYRCLMV